MDQNLLFGFAAALGGGLLIGVERERRKGVGATRALAGIRTFTLASLTGATAGFLQQPLLTFAGALLVLTLAAIDFWRRRARDPGVTTALALFITYLLGVVAMPAPVFAVGGSIVVATLLAARRALHEFSVEVLTESELRDGLLFAACALIVLPLLPDVPGAWLAVGSPRRLFAVAVTFMGLQAAGYVALRVAGVRLGLALSGLVAGFISSTTTIAAFGTRARADPRLRAACVSGALFSSVATVTLLGIIVITVYPQALVFVGPSLLTAFIAALVAASLSLLFQRGGSALHRASGRAFNLLHAIGFATLLAGVTAMTAIINSWLGNNAASVAVGIAGLFDVHAAATSTLSLAAKGVIRPSAVLLPILIAFSTNTVSKVVAAFSTGGLRYGLPVTTGLLGIAAAAWLPLVWVLH